MCANQAAELCAERRGARRGCPYQVGVCVYVYVYRIYRRR
jgi:hypothetical protein